MVRELKGKHPKYFEATVQLRDISQEVINWFEKKLEQFKVVIVKVQKVKNGFDYFLADNNQARQLGKNLQQKFGGHLLVTSSLHTKKDNKELYRTTHLFREAHFKKGNEVNYQGEEYKVIIMTKDILLQNIKTGKKVHVKYKDMNQIKTV